ncbi:Inactive ubiquitin carboxyl-terminal hydrolase 54 [Phytophthora citrophthora]|uniref:Inactive ubiquitin carboxyl-terminal hydrolase 54 n=1 Tax=Phytophthora citrophthora TaxID=4793 RepID=A0AAD9GTT4_9STRA|nr:Inactive ubiquitin carboxyl-terminal hydrolase 54 [Phytophthora citrophthora]
MSRSTRPLSARKGLRNDLGSNNCFLNVIIQSLWHVRSCRVLISMGDHAVHHRLGGKPTNAGSQMTETITPCLLCELEQIFVMYQFAEQPVLDVDRVRLALGDTFALGAMNDATETLETILDALHYDTFNRMLLLRRRDSCSSSVIGGIHKVEEMTESVRQDASAIICEPQCVAHRLFQMNLMELKVCSSCGHTAEPIMNTDFLYRVYAQELLNNAREEGKGVQKSKTLEEVLRLEAQSQDVAGTCDSCEKGGQRALSRWILTLPMVFSISIIWSSSHVNKTDIKDWMELLSTQCQTSGDDQESQQALDLGRIFRLDLSTEVSSLYSFRGMVCYYGRHYVGFFASRSLDDDGVERERWFLFDDTRVKLVGTWADVRLRIERGGYQPTLLFYERNGIEHDNLEKIAAEIHKWWEATADEPEVTKNDEVAVSKPAQSIVKNGKGAPHEVGLAGGLEDDLLARMERSVRITQENPLPPFVPTGPTKLPTSPIALPPRAPQSMPVKNGSQAAGRWRDEDTHLSMAHQSAQDTLSRLNGILSKDKAPVSTPVDGRAALRMAMSQSMRNSVRLRDYSVHRPTEKQIDVNPDKIFEDDTPAIEEEEQDTEGSSPSTSDETALDVPQFPQKVYDVRLSASDGGIGLLLEETTSDGDESTNAKRIFTVSGFEVNGAGEKLAAEASGAIHRGDVLVGINGHMLEDEELVHVLEMLLMSPNPVQLKFHRFQSWACPRCTLLNKGTASECAVCGHAPTGRSST